MSFKENPPILMVTNFASSPFCVGLFWQSKATQPFKWLFWPPRGVFSTKYILQRIPKYWWSTTLFFICFAWAFLVAEDHEAFYRGHFDPQLYQPGGRRALNRLLKATSPLKVLEGGFHRGPNLRVLNMSVVSFQGGGGYNLNICLNFILKYVYIALKIMSDLPPALPSPNWETQRTNWQFE